MSAASTPLRVLMATSEWPTPQMPHRGPFIVRQVEHLRAAGVQVEVAHFQGDRQLGNWVRAWKDIRRQIRAGGFDLVHAQGGPNGVMGLPKTCPLVVTYRGSDLHGVKDEKGRITMLGRVGQILSHISGRRADGVILVSAHLKQYLRATAPTAVIPSGLDLNHFKPTPQDEARRRLGLPADTRLILFAGNPDRGLKRHPLAVSAVARLDPALGAKLQVSWPCSHEQMPLWMNACDVLLLTSTHEGSPNVVKEALACNLPVVSVPVGDVSVRLAGLAGCEATADDRPETLAAALERSLRRGKRADSRASVESLDETLLTRQVIQLYQAALARAGK